MGSRNCFLALFCGIIIEKELHVLKHKVRSLSLSLRFFRGEEEETKKKKKKNNNERAKRVFVSKRKDSFVIYNFRNARDLSFESSHEKKTNKNRNVIQFDIKKKKNKPKEHHRASHSITENESNGEGRGKWRQCDRG